MQRICRTEQPAVQPARQETRHVSEVSGDLPQSLSLLRRYLFFSFLITADDHTTVSGLEKRNRTKAMPHVQNNANNEKPYFLKTMNRIRETVNTQLFARRTSLEVECLCLCLISNTPKLEKRSHASRERASQTKADESYRRAVDVLVAITPRGVHNLPLVFLTFTLINYWLIFGKL